MSIATELFGRLIKWKESIPIKTYRYTGHPTIYTSTTSVDGFQPSERAVLVHRYANRYLAGKYVRFYLGESIERGKHIKYYCWQFAKIITINHENNQRAFGYLRVRCFVANTMSIEEVVINPNTEIFLEEITEQQFNELVKIVGICKKPNKEQSVQECDATNPK